MDLKRKRIEIQKLIRNYAPKDTEFYWHNDTRDSVGLCKAKYCSKNKVFYDYEIAISYKFATSHSWEEVRMVAIQEIAHARTLGKKLPVWIKEYKHLKSIIDKKEKSQSPKTENKAEKAPGNSPGVN